MHKLHPLAWKSEPTDYAQTHCKKCTAGWTRSGPNGTGVIVCLLDREPVLPGMIDCDRYEPKGEGQQLNLKPKDKRK